MRLQASAVEAGKWEVLTIVASDENIAKGLFELPLDVFLQANGGRMLSQTLWRRLWWVGASQMPWGTSVCSIAMFM